MQVSLVKAPGNELQADYSIVVVCAARSQGECAACWYVVLAGISKPSAPLLPAPAAAVAPRRR